MTQLQSLFSKPGYDEDTKMYNLDSAFVSSKWDPAISYLPRYYYNGVPITGICTNGSKDSAIYLINGQNVSKTKYKAYMLLKLS
jgi:hypothetical protein